MDGTESGHASRVSAYAAVGSRLSLYCDRQLRKAVAAAPELGSGIGGRSAEMEVEETRVFVKRVPLTTSSCGRSMCARPPTSSDCPSSTSTGPGRRGSAPGVNWPRTS